VGTCEFHIFDMDDFGKMMPPELEGAHYHQWGLKRQGEDVLTEPEVRVDHYHSNVSISHSYFGLRDIVRYLGHEKLEMIDIFKIDCEFFALYREGAEIFHASVYYCFSYRNIGCISVNIIYIYT
jgi:hypothetical protein